MSEIYIYQNARCNDKKNCYAVNGYQQGECLFQTAIVLAMLAAALAVPIYEHVSDRKIIKMQTIAQNDFHVSVRK